MDTEHLKMILDTLKDVSHGALAFGILYIVLYFLLPILMALIIVRAVRVIWAKAMDTIAERRAAKERDADTDNFLRQLYDMAGHGGRFMLTTDIRLVLRAAKAAYAAKELAEKLPPSERFAKLKELGYYE